MALGRPIPATAYGLSIRLIVARPFKSRHPRTLATAHLTAALGHQRRGPRTRFGSFGCATLPQLTCIGPVLLRYFDFWHVFRLRILTPPRSEVKHLKDRDNSQFRAKSIGVQY